jgi:hypothetical protein
VEDGGVAGLLFDPDGAFAVGVVLGDHAEQDFDEPFTGADGHPIMDLWVDGHELGGDGRSGALARFGWSDQSGVGGEPHW